MISDHSSFRNSSVPMKMLFERNLKLQRGNFKSGIRKLRMVRLFCFKLVVIHSYFDANIFQGISY